MFEKVGDRDIIMFALDFFALGLFGFWLCFQVGYLV